MLKHVLEYRRAIRDFDPEQQIDTSVVRSCLEKAQLTATSSNMQLWEAYHVTEPSRYPGLVEACLGQQAARTAQQFVVFVVRPDLTAERAKANLEFETENIKRHSPKERQTARIKQIELYYGKVMPFLYGRALGLLGALRVLITQIIGLFRPIVRQVSEGDVNVVRHKSCGMVAQTFMLAMAEAGYDTCPLEGIDTLRVKRILGLPGSAEINMVIPCGVRKAARGERFRIPFSEQYHTL